MCKCKKTLNPWNMYMFIVFLSFAYHIGVFARDEKNDPYGFWWSLKQNIVWPLTLGRYASEKYVEIVIAHDGAKR